MFQSTRLSTADQVALSQAIAAYDRAKAAWGAEPPGTSSRTSAELALIRAETRAMETVRMVLRHDEDTKRLVGAAMRRQTTEQPSSSAMETVRAEGSPIGDSPQGSIAPSARLIAGGAR